VTCLKNTLFLYPLEEVFQRGMHLFRIQSGSGFPCDDTDIQMDAETVAVRSKVFSDESFDSVSRYRVADLFTGCNAQPCSIRLAR